MSGGFPTATQARSEAAKRSIGESRHLHAMTAVSFVLVSSWPVLARAHRPFNSTDAAVAAKGELERPLGFVKEVQTIVSGLAGVIWRVREVLSLDAGLRLARAGDVDTTEVRLGLTWAFGVGLPR